MVEPQRLDLLQKARRVNDDVYTLHAQQQMMMKRKRERSDDDDEAEEEEEEEDKSCPLPKYMKSRDVDVKSLPRVEINHHHHDGQEEEEEQVTIGAAVTEHVIMGGLKRELFIELLDYMMMTRTSTSSE